MDMPLGRAAMLLLAGLILAGIALSSTAASLLRRLAGPRPVVSESGDADPLEAIGLLHHTMFVLWLASGYVLFGAIGAGLLLLIGLLLPRLPPMLRWSGAWMRRVGLGAAARASLAAEAAVSASAMLLYAVTFS